MALVDASEYAASPEAQAAEKAAMSYQDAHPETSSYLPTGYRPTSPGTNQSAADANQASQLDGYRASPGSAQSTLQNLKDTWQQRMDSGDIAGAQSVHDWATQVRQAAGISDTDPTYGAYNPTPSSGVNIDGTNISQPSSSMPTGYDYTTRTGDQVANDGSLHLNVGGQNQSDVKVSQGQSYGSAQDIASSLGLQYKRDPQGNVTLNGTSFLPIGFDKNGNPMLNYRDVADAMGFKVNYDDASKTISISKPVSTTPNQTPGGNLTDPRMAGAQPQMNQGYPTQQGQNVVGGLMGQMPQQPQVSPFQAPDLSGYQNQMMPYQNFNADWNNYYNQAHGQLDPQYQTQYNNLMSKQTTDLTKMDESMNRRGIYTSGLAEAAANDLRAKTTNAVATVFGNQQAAINKMAQQLYTDAYKQYHDGNQMAMKNNEFMMTQMLNQEKQAFTQWLSTQQLGQSQFQYAINAWDKMASVIQNGQKIDQTAFQFDNLSANQTATLNMEAQKLQQQRDNALLPYQFETANNAANNQSQNWRAMLPYQLQTANNQASTQLEMWKMLGYIQNADGSLTPTQQTTSQNRDYALNFAKAMGYTVNADGSVTPTEQARHNMAQEQLTASGQTITANHNAATEQNAADSLRLRLYEMMGYDQNGTPTLNRQKLDESISHDSQTVQIAKDNATTSANRSIVDGIGKQLSAINSQISAAYNSGMYVTDKAQKQQIQAQIQQLSTQRDQYLNQLSQYTKQGFVGN